MFHLKECTCTFNLCFYTPLGEDLFDAYRKSSPNEVVLKIRNEFLNGKSYCGNHALISYQGQSLVPLNQQSLSNLII